MQNVEVPMKKAQTPVRMRSNTCVDNNLKPRVKHSAKRLSVPLPHGDTETSPRQCDLCGQVKYTLSAVPPNSPAIPALARACSACAKSLYTDNPNSLWIPGNPMGCWEDKDGVKGPIFTESAIPWSKGNGMDAVVTCIKEN